MWFSSRRDFVISDDEIERREGKKDGKEGVLSGPRTMSVIVLTLIRNGPKWRRNGRKLRKDERV